MRPAVVPPQHLVALLAAFNSLVVLTTNVYLPVLPQLGADLGASNAAAAATVSAVLVGIAVGQIVIGSLSDAVGRRGPLLLGCLGYAVTHVISALAPNLVTLLAVRLVAGVAAAACIAVARAVVADVYLGAASAAAFAPLVAVTAVVPVVAPVAGGLLATVMTWRGIFVLLGVVAVLVTAVGWRLLPETLPRTRRIPLRFGAIVRELGAVLRLRPFLAYVVSVAATGAVLFGYLGASAFVLQRGFGLSPQEYSVILAIISVGFLGSSWATRRLVRTVDTRRLLLAGQIATVVGAAVLAAGVRSDQLALILAGLFVAVGSLGVVLPTATALGMGQAAGRAGSASGVMGIVQFAVGATASPLAGLGGTPWSLVVVVAVGSVAGLAGRALLVHSFHRQANTP